MTSEISSSSASNTAWVEQPNSSENLIDKAEEAIEREDFETAFEIIHRLDEDPELLSKYNLLKVMLLFKKVFCANISKGFELIETPFQKISFGGSGGVLACGIVDGPRLFILRIEETHQILQRDIYDLFLEEGKTEQLQGKIKGLLKLAEMRIDPYDDLIRFFSDLAMLNVGKFKSLIPFLAPNFQVTLEGSALTFKFGITKTVELGYDLQSDFPAVIRFIDAKESVNDQVQCCFEMMKLHPKKEKELLAKAEECFSNAATIKDQLHSLYTFADYYCSKQNEAKFHLAVWSLEIIADTLSDDYWTKRFALFRIAGLEAAWSLSRSDHTSFEKHLSTAKQLTNRCFPFAEAHYAITLIKKYEAEGMKRFGSVTLSMQPMKV